MLVLINLVYAPFLYLLVMGGMPRWYLHMYIVGVIILFGIFLLAYKLETRNRFILLMCCMAAMLLTHTQAGKVFGILIPSLTVIYILVAIIYPARYQFLFWVACGIVGSYVWLQSASNLCNYLVILVHSIFSADTKPLLKALTPWDFELALLSIVVVSINIFSIAAARVIQLKSLTIRPE